jgi:hypothetical protein
MDPRRVFVFLIFGLISGLILISGSAFADIDVKEGEWEHTIEMVMEGMPFSMPPTKVNICVTKDDLVPGNKTDDDNCKKIYGKVNGNTVSFKTECMEDNGTKTEAEGEITYSGTSYKGQITSKSSGGKKKRRGGRRHEDEALRPLPRQDMLGSRIDKGED